MSQKRTFEATILSKTETDTEKFVKYLPTAIGDYKVKPKTQKVIEEDGDMFDELEAGRTYQVTCLDVGSGNSGWISVKLSSKQNPLPQKRDSVVPFKRRHIEVPTPSWRSNVTAEEIYAF